MSVVPTPAELKKVETKELPRQAYNYLFLNHDWDNDHLTAAALACLREWAHRKAMEYTE